MKGWLGRIYEVFFTFEGRLNRKRFWLRMSVLYLLAQGLAALGAYLFPLLGLSSSLTMAYSVGMTILFWLGSASLWVRRFHDRNVSGWWYALFFAFIFVAALYLIYAVVLTGGDATAPDMVRARYLVVAALMAWLYVAIRFGFRSGTPGENRYGPDPLGKTVPLPEEIHIS